VHVVRVLEIGNAYKILVGKPEGKTRRGRLRRTLEDNDRMDIREIGWKGVDWIHLAQGRDRWRGRVNTLMNLRLS
jgi:hypothetical protein